jgi:hypothetical protein
MKFNIVKMSVVLQLVVGLLVPAGASILNSGKVVAVYAYGNKGLVDTSGSPSTQPSCATSTNWAFDLTTAAGQAKYATAMTAFTTHANILIFGAGTCGDWGDRETIEEIGLVS